MFGGLISGELCVTGHELMSGGLISIGLISGALILGGLMTGRLPSVPLGAVPQPDCGVLARGAASQARPLGGAVGRAGRPELLRVGADPQGDRPGQSAHHPPTPETLHQQLVPGRRPAGHRSPLTPSHRSHITCHLSLVTPHQSCNK